MIRELTKKDLNDSFFELYYEGFLYHYNHRKDLFKKKSKEELKEYVFEQFENGLKILGYFNDEELIGYIEYEIKEKATKFIWIDELIITEKERGKGYGTLLMNEIKRMQDVENIPRIELNVFDFNDIAIKLYKKLGYKEQRYIFELKKGE